MRDARSSRRPPLWWVVAAFALAAIIAALVLRFFVVQPFNVPSGSMEPTLNPGEMILVDRTSRADIHRGDVVVFDGAGYFAPSADSGSGYWVKRVIGTSGDTVECCSDTGRLLVNGDELNEPYLFPGDAASDPEFSVKVPEGRLFLLGDHRSDSSDSRDHLGDPGGGMIPEDRVQGHVSRVVWPLRDWRVVTP